MRALPALVLASCSALTFALRGHSNSTQDEEGESKKTPCVCLLKEAETEHEELKLAVLESSPFDSGQECYKGCPRHCHKKLRYHLSPSEAQAMGAEDVSVPMVASKCNPVWRCSCLDADTAMERVNEYKGSGQQLLDIAVTKKVYGTSSQCLSECRNECKDKNYESLCLDEWDWEWALYSTHNQLPFPDHRVGFATSSYTQQFQLNKDGTGSGRGCKAQLQELEDDSGNELRNIKLDIAKFEAESSASHHTTEAEIGLKAGQKTKWTLGATSSADQPDWEVLDKNGEVAFIIAKHESDDGVWLVYGGKNKKKEDILFQVEEFEDEGEGEDDLDEDDLDQVDLVEEDPGGFEFAFYRGVEKEHWAGRVQRRREKLMVEVVPGDEAGLLLIVSVIMDKIRG